MNRQPESERSIVLVNGPRVGLPEPFPDDPKGGVVTAFRTLMTHFSSDSFKLRPCFFTPRGTGWSRNLDFPLRLIRDSFMVIRRRHGASGIHIFGQYRTAAYREFVITLIAKALRLPVLYQVRAGEFIKWHKHTGSLQRYMISFILRSSRVVLCEGQPYVDYLFSQIGVSAALFPNYVWKEDVPREIPARFHEDCLRIIYAGAITEEKGVLETIQGCCLAATQGVKIKLVLAGKESEVMSNQIDLTGDLPAGMELVRAGSVDRDYLMGLLQESDIFCMPTRYPGEGHSNAINEAMMWGLAVICTRQGFLESVLGANGAYYLERGYSDEIAAVLVTINSQREVAREKGLAARKRLIDCFTSDKAFKDLELYYKTLVDPVR